jgi:calcyclin binding protein
MSALLKIKEYEQDILELNTLVKSATRTNVKLFLGTQLDKWRSELVKLEKSSEQTEKKPAATTTGASSSALPTPNVTGFVKKIEQFGWDQSEKFVKIYITSLKNIGQVKESDLENSFLSKSFSVTIKNLNNMNYNMSVPVLCNEIEPAQSYVKCKNEMVTIFLKKAKVGETWADLVFGKQKEKMEMPKMDENADPQAGLMSMMKKMYEEGDDEMKRTIGKAFTESREKGGAPMGMPGGMGGMPGM